MKEADTPDIIIAAGPVIIENNQVLLNREIKFDGHASPYFMFPGGTLDDFSEDPRETCQREAKEELGIDIHIIRPLETLIVDRPDRPGKTAILLHYLATRNSDIVPGKETVEWGWYDLDNLPDNTAPNVADVLTRYKNEAL